VAGDYKPELIQEYERLYARGRIRAPMADRRQIETVVRDRKIGPRQEYSTRIRAAHGRLAGPSRAAASRRRRSRSCKEPSSDAVSDTKPCSTNRGNPVHTRMLKGFRDFRHARQRRRPCHRGHHRHGVRCRGQGVWPTTSSAASSA